MSELLQKILDQISKMPPEQKTLYLNRLKQIIATAKKQCLMNKGKKQKKTEKLATILEFSEELNSELSITSPKGKINEFDFEYLDDDCNSDSGDSELVLPTENFYKFFQEEH